MATNTYSFTGGSQTFVARGGGYYFIQAFGAAGGNSQGGSGGAGAGASGDFTLSAGEVLTLVVGGAGDSAVSGSGGGGGATFVIETDDGAGAVQVPLLIAGGGGGSGYSQLSSGAGGASYAISAGMGGAGSGGGGEGGYSGGIGGGPGEPGAAGAGRGFGYAGGAGTYGGAGGYGGGGSGGFQGGGGGGGGYGGGSGGYGAAYGGGGGGSLDTGNGALLVADINGSAGSVSITPLCFLQGTHILTPTGPVRVEELRIGDTVVTRFGGIQPIRWIGRQSHSAAAARQDPSLVPVRITAGALAERVPARDLFISPGHSVLVDGVLVLARLLVNGATVTQDWCPQRIEYYHLELALHDCVIAEGAWAETYADAQRMRDAFHNADDYDPLYPDAGPAPDDFTLCAARPERGPLLAAALQDVIARASQRRARKAAERDGGSEAPVAPAGHLSSVRMYSHTSAAARR